MKNRQYLNELPKGGIVTNKRVLAALKKKRLISGYSPYGYLECVNVIEKETKKHWGTCWYLFPKGDAPKEEKISVEKYGDLEQNINVEIEYQGHKFQTKFLDGCLSAYLQKTSGDDSKKENPQISLWGVICNSENIERQIPTALQGKTSQKRIMCDTFYISRFTLERIDVEKNMKELLDKNKNAVSPTIRKKIAEILNKTNKQ